jgi:hypothetical protein
MPLLRPLRLLQRRRPLSQMLPRLNARVVRTAPQRSLSEAREAPLVVRMQEGRALRRPPSSRLYASWALAPAR